jgi:hypothetical protein
MEMKSACRNTSPRSFIAAVGLAFVAALLVVPGAFGGGDQGLDPWMYSVLRPSASEVVTEHSAGQNDAHRSESGGIYGPLDPWAYRAVHQAAPVLITEHSAGQDPNRPPIAAPVNYRIAAISGGFDWGDAGVGAGATVGLMVVLLGCVAVQRRRMLAQAHP